MRKVQKILLYGKKTCFNMFLGAFLLIGLGGTSCLQAQTTWTGLGADDSWFTNANWNTGLAPNGITIDVILGAPSPTIASGTININSLTVNAGGDLQTSGNFNFGGAATTTLTNAGSISVGNNSDFQLSGTVNNSGSISANYTGGSVTSDLEVVSGGATLGGGGTITLFGNNARVMGLSGAVLTLNAQTIQGNGQVGANTLGLVINSGGTVDANSTVGSLILDASSAGVTNQGTLKASGGGVLRIDDSIIDNTSGSIQALAGSTVQLDDSTITGGTLSGAGQFEVVGGTNVFLSGLSHSATMAVANNTDLGITGTINNSGSISLNFTGGAVHSDLEIQAGSAILDGGGTITLNGNNARVTGGLGGNLTIANQTIQGGGQIGTNNLSFTNSATGLIDANVSGATMIVDTAVAGATNLGVMRASNGGVMRFSGSIIDNTGGSIESLAGSTVELDDSTISGGTLSGSGSYVVLGGSNVFLRDLTQSSTLSVSNNSDLGITGTINNTGNMSLNHTGGAVHSDLEIQSTGATLDGGGTISMFGSGARVTGGLGGSLTIANQTIQGGGQIGTNNLSFTNSATGLIDANVSGATMIVDTAVAGATNLGVMRASNGGVMRFSGSVIDNTGGSIESLAGSTVELDDSTISGGTLSGSGSYVVLGGSNVFLGDLTQSSTLSVSNNSDLGITGTINNTGNMSLNHTGGAVHSDLEIQASGATLDGGGTISMFGSGARVTGGLGGSLTIANQTLQGEGNIGANNLSFVNASGLIDANSSGNTLNVDPIGVSAVAWTNDGILRASNGGILNSVHNTINNGTIDAQASSSFLAPFLTNNGVIQGNGLVDLSNNLINNGLISAGASPGTLTFDVGLATLNSTSELLMEIAGAGAGQFDLLDFNFDNSVGKLSLDGLLTIDLDGYLPDASDMFVVLTADNNNLLDGPDLLGMFSNVANGGTLTTLGGEGFFTVSYGSGGNGNQVLLSNFVLTVPEPGSAVIVLAGMLFATGFRRRRP